MDLTRKLAPHLNFVCLSLLIVVNVSPPTNLVSNEAFIAADSDRIKAGRTFSLELSKPSKFEDKNLCLNLWCIGLDTYNELWIVSIVRKQLGPQSVTGGFKNGLSNRGMANACWQLIFGARFISAKVLYLYNVFKANSLLLRASFGPKMRTGSVA